MPFNLIHDVWISIRRTNGRIDTIAPHQLTDEAGEDGPAESLAAPRGDFDGALIQFLIGLVQTTFPPEDEDQWAELLETPPSPQVLKEAFERYAHAFNLDGDGPRFMQDYNELDARSSKAISNLLLDTPTGKTLRDNADHFIKTRESACYDEATAAMALMTLQFNAPSGGRGHRTSLRGGGPVTTVLMGPTLWKTVWLNVLTPSTLEAIYDVEAPSGEAAIFPWMADTRTSEKKGGTSTKPGDVYPLQMYWSMPRRVCLEQKRDEDGYCSISGAKSTELYDAYVTKAYGVNYEGPWQHPLTPHRWDGGQPMPVHGQLGGFSYRNWLGFVFADGDSHVEPALVVRQFFERANEFQHLDPVLDQRPNLWVFGFDTDKMKVRSWHESVMPIIALPDQQRFRIEGFAKRLIRATEHVAYQLSDALKKALYGTPSVSPTKKGGRNVSWEVSDGVSRDQSFFANAEHQMWQNTESAFYQKLHSALERVETDAPLDDLRQEWQAYLQDVARFFFDELTQHNTFRSSDPRAIVLARQKLNFSTSHRSKKMTQLLHLPKKVHA